jgi:glucose repression regulatory protein TUP1
VWDIERKTVVSRFPGHESEIYSLAFSPDGNFLVSGSGDRSAHIWDLRSGEKRFVLTIDPEPSADGRGDDAGVTSVAVSPDGKLVAAGSLDYSVRVWDLHSGILVDRLQGHKDSVYSVAFAPDGKWLVSGSLDKSLKLWDLALLRNRQPNDPTEATMGKTLCTTTLSGHKVRPRLSWPAPRSRFAGLCPLGRRVLGRQVHRLRLQGPQRLLLESEVAHRRRRLAGP